MTKYLISFPSSAMVFPPEELQAVSDASHAVVQEAKDAGVWVFGRWRTPRRLFDRALQTKFALKTRA